jgi:indole-3-glycerol phosphate synthase
MSDILDRILAVKRREIAAGLERTSMAALEAAARAMPAPRDFVGAMRAKISAGDAAALGAARAGAGARTGTTRARLRPARTRGRNGVMKGPCV